MSYILDALKKSNRERNGERSNDLHIVHNSAVMASRPRFSLSRKLGWLLLLVILVLVGSVFFYNAMNDNVVSRHGGGSGSQIVIASKINVMDTIDELGMYDQGESGEVVVPDSPYRKKIIKREKLKRVLVTGSPEKDSGLKKDAGGIPSRLDLPAALQKELPKLRFAGHTYSDDPARRLIIINNEIRHEGDRLDANTKLVEIVWEGVILEYKGVVFEEKLNL